MFTVRRSNERGYADHGWLKSFHTFSFAGYYDPDWMGFGPLRVINEDRVEPGQGFGTHGHRDMEIISYVLEGKLSHMDSLGHQATIGPGTVQRISAGTGIQHSEFNGSTKDLVHFLQIWIEPDRRGAKPHYQEAHFDIAPDVASSRQIATHDGRDGTIQINQDASLHVAVLPAGAEGLTHRIDFGRLAYVHVARGKVTAEGHALEAGDALMARDEASVSFADAEGAELLIFDLPRD